MDQGVFKQSEATFYACLFEPSDVRKRKPNRITPSPLNPRNNIRPLASHREVRRAASGGDYTMIVPSTSQSGASLSTNENS